MPSRAGTPAAWLAGTGLVGDTLTVPGFFNRPWMYFAPSGIFLVFHNLHAALAYRRAEELSPEAIGRGCGRSPQSSPT